jgi:hypothetical protein
MLASRSPTAGPVFGGRFVHRQPRLPEHFFKPLAQLDIQTSSFSKYIDKSMPEGGVVQILQLL